MTTDVPPDPGAPEGPTADPALTPAPAPLRVVFQDEHFVAVSKPSGLLVHRDEHHPDAPAALQTVRDQTGKFLFPFHRLDRGTSGILLFAFSTATAAALQQSLGDPTAHKDYLALTRWPGSGGDLGEHWVSERPLTDDKGIAREARSQFDLVETFHRCALVRCRIFTGRYHQIRRHLNHCGRHVIGDTTHGKGRINALFRQRHGLDRLFLHLNRISLRHPVTGSVLELVDPMPMELDSVVHSLRQQIASGCNP